MTRSIRAIAGAALVTITLSDRGVLARAHQFESQLSKLTVPLNRLPGDCRLQVVPRGKDGKPEVIGFPALRENPWVGRDPVKGASIRRIIDGPALTSEPDRD